MQLNTLGQPATKFISKVSGCEVGFFVIEKTNVRLSCEDCAVLIIVSVGLCTFSPELSVAHFMAIFHFTSQSGPTLHVILSRLDRLLSRPLNWEQLQIMNRALPRTITIRFNGNASLCVRYLTHAGGVAEVVGIWLA